MYVQIMKKCTVGGHFLCGADREFVDAFEAQEFAKVRGGSEQYREAVREIEAAKFEQLEHLGEA
jgi:hypothetical protein